MRLRRALPAYLPSAVPALCSRGWSPTLPTLHPHGLALATAQRGAATYPTPRTSSRARQRTKTYNYLTGERLVRTPRARLSRTALRNRDDKALQRRRDYRNDVLRDVEEKIHFFSPEVKSYVFFPQNRTQATRRTFRGNRVLPTRTFTRIYVDLIDRLVKRSNRGRLLELMAEVGVEVPSAKVFRRYTDPVSGDITAPLLYSPWMERYFQELSRKYVAAAAEPRTPDGHLDTRNVGLSPHQALVLLHTGDEARVPSLGVWSHQLGPLKPSLELIEAGRAQRTVSEVLVESRREVITWARDHIEAQLAPLTLAEQQSLVDDAIDQFEVAMGALKDRLLFGAKVLLAINALPEVKAIQAPSKVFLKEQDLRAVIAQEGLYYPPSPASLADWRAMTAEQQQAYYCFRRKAETTSVSGLQLYTRYCTRDYGLARYESAKRFGQLSDVQQAALNFPFYYPIAPKSTAVRAFRKFYLEMCARYGLSRVSSSASVGNHVFEATMRKRWRLMSPEERAVYLRDDTILAAFPLQPAGGRDARPARAEDGEGGAEIAVAAAVTTEPDLLHRADMAARRAGTAGGKARRRATRTTSVGGSLFVYGKDSGKVLQPLRGLAGSASSEGAGEHVGDEGDALYAASDAADGGARVIVV